MRARSTVFSSLSWTSTGGNPIWWKNGRQSSTTGLVIVWSRFGSLHREDFACYLFLDSTISTSKIHFVKLTANAFWNWPNLPQVEPTLFQPSRCQLAVSFRECLKEKKGNSNPVLPTQLWSLFSTLVFFGANGHRNCKDNSWGQVTQQKSTPCAECQTRGYLIEVGYQKHVTICN